MVLILIAVVLILLAIFIAAITIFVLSQKGKKFNAYTKILSSHRNNGELKEIIRSQLCQVVFVLICAERGADMNNPVYGYADDSHARVNCELQRSLGDVDDKSEVFYYSVGLSASQVTTTSETKAHDTHAHCPMANSAAKVEESHYEIENGKVS